MKRIISIVKFEIPFLESVIPSHVHYFVVQDACRNSEQCGGFLLTAPATFKGLLDELAFGFFKMYPLGGQDDIP